MLFSIKLDGKEVSVVDATDQAGADAHIKAHYPKHWEEGKIKAVPRLEEGFKTLPDLVNQLSHHRSKLIHLQGDLVTMQTKLATEQQSLMQIETRLLELEGEGQ